MKYPEGETVKGPVRLDVGCIVVGEGQARGYSGSGCPECNSKLH